MKVVPQRANYYFQRLINPLIPTFVFLPPAFSFSTPLNFHQLGISPWSYKRRLLLLVKGATVSITFVTLGLKWSTSSLTETMQVNWRHEAWRFIEALTRPCMSLRHVIPHQWDSGCLGHGGWAEGVQARKEREVFAVDGWLSGGLVRLSWCCGLIWLWGSAHFTFGLETLPWPHIVASSAHRTLLCKPQDVAVRLSQLQCGVTGWKEVG